MKILAPSILSADLSNLAQQIRYIEMGGADWIHCDVMDGHFVPNLTFGSILVKAAHNVTKLPLDVHLMISNPDNFIEDFANAGADTITVHQEASVHLHRAISKIQEMKKKAGVSINPATPVSSVREVIEEIDLLLIMSVNPGFGGQSFIKRTLQKIEEAAKLRNSLGLNFLIEVDGGINNQTIKNVLNAGCDVFVAGSSIFGADNITASCMELKNLISNH